MREKDGFSGVIILVTIFLFAVFLIGRGGDRTWKEGWEAAGKVAKYQAQEERAHIALAQIAYIKDQRTGLCFAITPSWWYNRPATLATIPCEIVPSNLLNAPRTQ